VRNRTFIKENVQRERENVIFDLEASENTRAAYCLNHIMTNLYDLSNPLDAMKPLSRRTSQ